MRIAVNFVIVYAAWFATVLSAAGGHAWMAAAASLVALLINLTLAQPHERDAPLLAAAALIGVIVEKSLMTAGFASYAAPGPISGWPPLWLILMWPVFATLLHVSLAWLKFRLPTAAVLGFFGGALAYYGGARLGAMQLTEPVVVSLAAIGTLWAIAFPLLLYLARRSDAGRATR